MGNKASGKGTCLWAVSGIVDAPVEKTWEALISLSSELAGTDTSGLAHADGIQVVSVSIGQSGAITVNVEVDPQARTITMQGQWWYRGVTAVEAHGDGSLLIRRIYNIAPPLTGWMVPFVHKHDDAAFRAQHETFLQRIGVQLQCDTRLLPQETR